MKYPDPVDLDISEGPIGNGNEWEMVFTWHSLSITYSFCFWHSVEPEIVKKLRKSTHDAAMYDFWRFLGAA